MLSDSYRSGKQIEEERETERSMAEPNWGLPCKQGLTLLTYGNIRITLPAMDILLGAT